MRWTRVAAIVPLWIALSVQQPRDPLDSFCRIFGHQAAVVDRRLYVDGGFVNHGSLPQDPKNYTNTALLDADLDVTNLGMPVLHSNLSKPSKVPDINGAILWSDPVNKILYLYGGEYSEGEPDPFALWAYNIVSSKWNSMPADPEYRDIQRASYGAGAVVEGGEFAYYYGGWLSNASVPSWGSTEPLALSSLLMYNMDQHTWTNSSGPDSIGRAEGAMVYLPASDRGMLVYFGGLQVPEGTGKATPQPMDEILLYDIANSKWYTQKATGQVPEDRRRFCAGATWASDYSSYNIYLYGGSEISEGVGFDDVYILSLPSFKWIKWYPTEPGPGYPHHSLSCNVVDGAQMIIIGGVFTNTTMCDVPNVYAMHNMDLGKQNPDSSPWYQFRPNLTTYKVPPEIVSAIGGSESGKANVTSPKGGFGYRDLNTYFQRVYTPPPRTPSHTPEDDDSTPVGAIAGGTVGGVAGVCIIVGGLYLWLRRRRKQKETPVEEAVSTPSAPETKPPTMYELPGQREQPIGELANTAPVELESPGVTKHFSLPGDHHQYQHSPLHSRDPSSPSAELPV
ncbi:hypothetical protein P168DRAFT_317623 [Aspergillus campestris IBT 28561]|uniref:Kelch repeat protein n=1 Tax=Aspergillus campestris (strain IBT 28561) TaxID=1392248 RepID=A0A2I1D8E9_ASPC2|nr:uncharacterized protein P168DRAFT_317623 [Aspergillus campestris IBT 28561]PKY06127.1 hypothetical protein P168DRAFT_317623 [Aspergillus campestris IBT 28561]